MRWIVLTALLISAGTPARAVREFVVIDAPFIAQQVEGVLVDPSGAPIPWATVSDCSIGWASVLRTTTTGSEGRFHLSRRAGRGVYFLRFDHPAFNPLGLKLKIDKNTAQRGIVARPNIGG